MFRGGSGAASSGAGAAAHVHVQAAGSSGGAQRAAAPPGAAASTTRAGGLRNIARDMFHPRVPSKRDRRNRLRFRTTWYKLTDVTSLTLFTLFVGGLVAVIVLGLHERLPDRYICEKYPCEDALGTYYTQVDKGRLPALSPCLFFPQPYAANCPRYETFYYEIMESNAVAMYVTASLVALAASVCVQLVYLVATEFVVEVTHAIIGITLWCAMAVAIYARSYWSIMWGVFALLQNVYGAWSRERMDDAVTVVNFAFRFFHEQWELQVLSYTLVVVQAGLFVAFILFYVTLNGRYGGWCDAFSIIAYLWVNQTIRMVGQIVASGVLGRWYYHDDKAGKGSGGGAGARPVSTLRVLCLTLVKHMGSVCFSAAVMALIKVSRVVYGLFRTATGAGAAVFVVLALIADAILSTFNHYGLCRIIMYGDCFFKSSKDAFTLLTESGIQEMMYDDIIIILNTATALASAAGACLIAFLMIKFDMAGNMTDVNEITVVYLPCFIVGFTVGCPVLDTLESIVMSLYMCFAEEPQTLETCDVELYVDLLDTWFDVQDDDEDDEDGGYNSDVSYSSGEDDTSANTTDDEGAGDGDGGEEEERRDRARGAREEGSAAVGFAGDDAS